MTTNLRPGLLILQGNRLEDLAAAVLGWLAAHPLGPLEHSLLERPVKKIRQSQRGADF